MFLVTCLSSIQAFDRKNLALGICFHCCGKLALQMGYDKSAQIDEVDGEVSIFADEAFMGGRNRDTLLAGADVEFNEKS